MNKKITHQLRTKIRFWIILFITGLVLSGITAFPVEYLLSIILNYVSYLPEFLQDFINKVYIGVVFTNKNYPFISYGTDWLGFAHIVIAIVFIGPYINPVKNIWVIQFGMIACIMVIPFALIAGPLRDIPFYWRLIDCSFGVFGLIPLYFIYKNIKKTEQINMQ